LHGNDFATIGKVESANSGKQKDYSHVDAGITGPGIDKVYYRLQQADLDGKVNYSKIVQLGIPVKGVYIAPNPAESFTAVYSQVTMPGAIIKLIDIIGKVLYNKNTNLIEGSKVAIPLAGYAKGIYTVIIQSAGTQQKEFKLMIK